MITIAEQSAAQVETGLRPMVDAMNATSMSLDTVRAFAAPFIYRSLMGGLHALPAPDVEVEIERYRGWPITWESGYGFAAQLSCHVDDCLGWCDTIEEIRAEIDAEIEDRRRSYGSHFHEDTPSLDDSFHRHEMEIG